MSDKHLNDQRLLEAAIYAQPIIQFKLEVSRDLDFRPEHPEGLRAMIEEAITHGLEATAFARAAFDKYVGPASEMAVCWEANGEFPTHTVKEAVARIRDFVDGADDPEKLLNEIIQTLTDIAAERYGHRK